MAGSDSTKRIHKSDYQRGALNMTEVIKLIPQIVAGGPEQTTPEYFAKHDAAIAAILSVAGPMPAKVEGAMAALAGLLVYTVQNGFPDLENGWLPPSALTSAELEDERVRFAAECDGEEVAA